MSAPEDNRGARSAVMLGLCGLSGECSHAGALPKRERANAAVTPAKVASVPAIATGYKNNETRKRINLDWRNPWLTSYITRRVTHLCPMMFGTCQPSRPKSVADALQSPRQEVEMVENAPIAQYGNRMVSFVRKIRRIAAEVELFVGLHAPSSAAPKFRKLRALR